MPLPQEAESVPDSDEEEALEIEEAPPLYPENVDVDEQRRTLIFEHLVSPEIDSEVQIKAAAQWERWLRDGEVPGAKKASLKQIRGERGDTAP